MKSKSTYTGLTRGRKNANKNVFNNACRLVTDSPQNFAASRFFLNFQVKVQRKADGKIH